MPSAIDPYFTQLPGPTSWLNNNATSPVQAQRAALPPAANLLPSTRDNFAPAPIAAPRPQPAPLPVPPPPVALAQSVPIAINPNPQLVKIPFVQAMPVPPQNPQAANFAMPPVPFSPQSQQVFVPSVNLSPASFGPVPAPYFPGQPFPVINPNMVYGPPVMNVPVQATASNNSFIPNKFSVDNLSSYLPIAGVAAGVGLLGYFLYRISSGRLGMSSSGVGSSALAPTKPNLYQRYQELKSKNIFTPEQCQEIESRLEQLGSSSAGDVNQRILNTILFKLPWDHPPVPDVSKNKEILTNLKTALDRSHYGMDDVKKQIIGLVAEELQLQQAYNGQIPSNLNRAKTICLVGPPGVGKTTIARSIAEALGKNFQLIPLGKSSDGSTINAGSSRYLSSEEGEIIKAFCRAKTRNALFLLDEIDKANYEKTGSTGGNATGPLLSLLDPEQNKTYIDNFIHMPYDVSPAMFVCTANKLEDIPETIQDRMQIIQLSGYSTSEKMTIAKKNIIPKLTEEVKWPAGSFKFTDGALLKLINEYAPEAGIRKLNEKIRLIQRQMLENHMKLGRQITSDDYETITENNLEKYLGGEPQYPLDILKPHNKPGVVQVLYYGGPLGGCCNADVIDLVNHTDNRSKGLVLKVSDNIKNTSKLALERALTYVKTHWDEIPGLPRTEPDKEIIVNSAHGDIGNLDGPSVGAFAVLGMISKLTNKPVPYNLAMTGTFHMLNEQIGKIGGLKEKITGSYAQGIRIFLISSENEQDLKKIPQRDIPDAVILKVNDIKDVLRIALDPKLRDSNYSSVKRYIESKYKSDLVHANTETFAQAA